MSEFESLASIFARMGIEAPQDVPPAEYQDLVQTKREAVWHRACQMRACRYATEKVDQANPPPVDSTLVCGGYHGRRYVEEDSGQALWRWRPCVRHVDWMRRRAAYLAGESPLGRRGGKRVDLDDDEATY